MKIAILGGGVGGLTSAIALKMIGFDVEVYERRANTAEIGAGIVCWSNAAFVLDQLGMLDQVAQVGGAVQRIDRFSSKGEPLGSLDVNIINQHIGYPSYSISRKDLMNILNQRVKQFNIKVHFGYNVNAISSDGSGRAIVHFDSNGAIQPDLVIAADGRMQSIARQFVNGDNRPVYQGFINWIGVFNGPVGTFSDISVADYWGVGRRFGIVPVSDQKAYWSAGAAATTIGHRDPENYKRDMLALFDGWDEMIIKIISQTPLARMNKVYVHDHNQIDVWHRENLLLIGDAAHALIPTSGQGACQALEDAWHLARYLKSTDGFEKAFQGFTEKRKDKNQSISDAGRHFARSLFNTDPDACTKRDHESINTDFVANAMGMARLWGSGLRKS